MYGRISIADMLHTESQAQYDGICERYRLPDTTAFLK